MIYFRPSNCLFLKDTDEYSSVKAMMPEDDSKNESSCGHFTTVISEQSYSLRCTVTKVLFMWW